MNTTEYSKRYINTSIKEIEENSTDEGDEIKNFWPRFFNMKKYDYLYINNLPKFSVQCNVSTFTSQYGNCVQLKNIKNFLRILVQCINQ